jgi:hypothetical protein
MNNKGRENQREKFQLHFFLLLIVQIKIILDLTLFFLLEIFEKYESK